MSTWTCPDCEGEFPQPQPVLDREAVAKWMSQRFLQMNWHQSLVDADVFIAAVGAEEKADVAAEALERAADELFDLSLPTDPYQRRQWIAQWLRSKAQRIRGAGGTSVDPAKQGEGKP